MPPVEPVPPLPDDGSGTAPEGSGAPTTAEAAAVARRRSLRWALAAGLLAGLASWSAGEALRGRYQRALEPDLGPFPTPKMLAGVRDDMTAYVAVVYGILGALTGGALGLAGGMSRRSAGRAVAAGVVGLLAGGAAGHASCLAALPAYYREFDPQKDQLVLAVLTHGAIWAALGAVGGLAYSIGRNGTSRLLPALLGGLLGGVAATLLFDLGAGLAFAVDRTSHPISATGRTRLLAHLAVALGVAAGAAWGAEPPASKLRPAPPPD